MLSVSSNCIIGQSACGLRQRSLAFWLCWRYPNHSLATPPPRLSGRNGLAVLFGDPTLAIPWIWKSCLLLLPISMSVVTWLLFRLPRQGLTRVQGWIRLCLTALPAGIGLFSGMSWIWEIPLSPTLLPIMASWPWLLWLSWPLLVGLVTPRQLYLAWQDGRIDWQSLPRPTFQQSIMLMAIGVLGLGLVALVSVGSLDRTIALGGFVLTWILLVEAIARGPLSRVLQRLIDWQRWSDMGIRVSNIGKRLGSWLRSLFSVPSMPVLLGKALVGMTILVMLNELPNAGKTLIQPFKVLGLPERTELGKSSEEREGAGQAIVEQVVNNLGLLQQELRQEVILSLQPDSEDEGGRKKFELMSVGDSTNVSAALSKSPDLEIGGVKIPLGLLFTPVQGPIRWLLGGARHQCQRADRPAWLFTVGQFRYGRNLEAHGVTRRSFFPTCPDLLGEFRQGRNLEAHGVTRRSFFPTWSDLPQDNRSICR